MEKKKHSEKLIDLKRIPHFSLLIPFNPLMIKKHFFLNLLKSERDKAEGEIKAKYSLKQAHPLIKNLRNLISQVKSIPQGKTLLIMVSGSAKNIYYFTTTKMLKKPSDYATT